MLIDSSMILQHAACVYLPILLSFGDGVAILNQIIALRCTQTVDSTVFSSICFYRLCTVHRFYLFDLLLIVMHATWCVKDLNATL